MSLLGTLDFVVTILFLYVERMNMGPQRKLRLWRKEYLVKLSVTSIMLFIKKPMNGLTLTLISLEGQPRVNKPREFLKVSPFPIFHLSNPDSFLIFMNKLPSFDSFENTRIAQDIFHKLLSQKQLIQDQMIQLYCESCSRFLADRFVEGTCPLCSYTDARGDQCDKCGKLLNASDLINPRCKMDGKTPVIRESTHLFLDLPGLQKKNEDWVAMSSAKGKVL